MDISQQSGNLDRATQSSYPDRETKEYVEEHEKGQSMPSVPSHAPDSSRSTTLPSVKESQESKYIEIAKGFEKPSHSVYNESFPDPTPKTPCSSAPLSRTASNAATSPFRASTHEDRESCSIEPTKKLVDNDSEDKDSNEIISSKGDDSKSEIQSIMDQFENSEDMLKDDTKSLQQNLHSSFLKENLEHLPRKSSCEPLRNSDLQSSESNPLLQSNALGNEVCTQKYHASSLPDPKSTLPKNLTSQPKDVGSLVAKISSPPSLNSSHKPLPPEPDPEPDLPFDFHRFLEQLRHRTADPVAKFLRSFLVEFGKKQWMVHEQIKIISDFLAFIANKMAQCEVWRGVSDAEFDNAKEGMEKLVMNRLYSQTFSPAIPSLLSDSGARGKQKNAERMSSTGRRGQHQEDIERDEILAQKVRIYGWVQEEHLEIPPVGESGRRFLTLAQQGGKLFREYEVIY